LSSLTATASLRIARAAGFASVRALSALSVLAALEPGASAQDLRRKQEIIFEEIPAHTVGDAPFDIVAKTNSGLPLALQVVAGPGVLDGKKLKLTGTPGLVVIRASQAGNAAFLPARDAERAFTVHPRPSAPVIRTQPGEVNLAAGDAVVLAVEASGEPEPELQWRKDGIPIAGAHGRRLSIGPAAFPDSGTYDVIASNPSGEARSAPARVTVGKRRQTISFQGATTAVAGQPILLSASASSGLPVQFEIVSGAAVLTGETLTSQGGAVVVQATQPGDSTFDAASPVTQTYIFSAGPIQRVP
jgi:hypothetical protein